MLHIAKSNVPVKCSKPNKIGVEARVGIDRLTASLELNLHSFPEWSSEFVACSYEFSARFSLAVWQVRKHLRQAYFLSVMACSFVELQRRIVKSLIRLYGRELCDFVVC
jgi:hypothetical protein